MLKNSSLAIVGGLILFILPQYVAADTICTNIIGQNNPTPQQCQQQNSNSGAGANTQSSNNQSGCNVGIPKIYQPQDRSVLYSSNVEVIGQAPPGIEVSVYDNNVLTTNVTSSPNGNFESVITLSKGWNQIYTSISACGNLERSSLINVLYTHKGTSILSTTSSQPKQLTASNVLKYLVAIFGVITIATIATLIIAPHTTSTLLGIFRRNGR